MTKIIKKSEKSLDAQEYVTILQEIRQLICSSQVQAYAAINVALNMRNCTIGKMITEKQEQYAWGSNFIELLASDLQKMYPGNHGFSVANVYRMKAFYQAYQNIIAAAINLEQLPIFMIPWFHNVVILTKVKDQEEALWYAQQALQQGWNRSSLEIQIQKELYHRQGRAISNFSQMLVDSRVAIMQETFKDPYVFDFLTLEANHLEQELELGLMSSVPKLLLEMGKGFSFYGRQYHVQVGVKDYYIDLLFYHTKLKCYVAVELKAREFDEKDAGQINFYISAVDNFVKEKDDNPTIGLVLCKTKDNLIAEYALRGINRPIGVAQYTTELMNKLQKELYPTLPSVAEIEAEFAKMQALHPKAEKQSKHKKIIVKKQLKTKS